jgi:hypothetical protein
MLIAQYLSENFALFAWTVSCFNRAFCLSFRRQNFWAYSAIVSCTFRYLAFWVIVVLKTEPWCHADKMGSKNSEWICSKQIFLFSAIVCLSSFQKWLGFSCVKENDAIMRRFHSGKPWSPSPLLYDSISLIQSIKFLNVQLQGSITCASVQCYCIGSCCANFEKSEHTSMFLWMRR